MTDLYGVAALGRTFSLDNDGCRELHRLVEEHTARTGREPSLEMVEGIVMGIKLDRDAGMRDGHQPVMTHDEWRGCPGGLIDSEAHRRECPVHR